MRRFLFVTAVLSAFAAGLFITAQEASAGQLFSSLAKAKVNNEAHVFKGGITIGGTGTKIDDSYAASATIDFASTTTTCNDSTGITVTGAAVNDVCFVGVPASGGSNNASYTCYVSAADTVKVRHCAAGTADDPASATFTVRVFDP